jgi:sulfate-transporting ATPase
MEYVTGRVGAGGAGDDVSFRVTPREVVGLIGPNGAGKTTIVDALTGFTKPNGGRMLLNGTPMTGRSWGPARRARAGVRRSFQSLELFEEVSVAENLHAGSGQHAIRGCGPVPAAGAPPTAVSSTREFGSTTSTVSGELPTDVGDSWGSRAIVGTSVLLLDEPAAASTTETSELGDLVRRFAVSTHGGAIERDVGSCSGLRPIVVLDFGRNIAEARRPRSGATRVIAVPG